MKLHEQVKCLSQKIENGKEEVEFFIEYLQSEKFSGNEDWIRTWEVQRVLKSIRDSLDGVA